MDGVVVEHCINTSMSVETIFPFVSLRISNTTHVPHPMVPWAIMEASSCLLPMWGWSPIDFSIVNSEEWNRRAFSSYNSIIHFPSMPIFCSKFSILAYFFMILHLTLEWIYVIPHRDLFPAWDYIAALPKFHKTMLSFD